MVYYARGSGAIFIVPYKCQGSYTVLSAVGTLHKALIRIQCILLCAYWKAGCSVRNLELNIKIKEHETNLWNKYFTHVCYSSCDIFWCTTFRSWNKCLILLCFKWPAIIRKSNKINLITFTISFSHCWQLPVYNILHVLAVHLCILECFIYLYN